MKVSRATTHVALCAALALCGVGGASAQVTGQQTGQLPRARARGQGGPAKGKPAAKDAASAATKNTPVAPPQVREIDEAALRALLDEHRQAGRRLLINFWATWCTPCREEFPDLVRLDEELGGRADFEFITVSLDDLSEIGKAVPAFLSETGAAAIPAYLINARDHEAVITLIDPTWHGDLPATFLFGPDGALLFRHTGRVKPDELRKAIEGSDK